QVRELGGADVAVVDVAQLRRRVDDLVVGDPGQRAADDGARDVAARLRRVEADRLERLPDGGDVLDADPVQLDVLPVGDVGGAAGVPGGDVGDGAQRPDVELPAVDPDPHHEVEVFELLVREGR